MIGGVPMDNKVFGKSIELFFVNGTSDGVITAELSNWSGKAIKIPRIEIGKYKNEELSYPGVYLLYCSDDDGTQKIYVGESEDVENRLKQHIADYERDKEAFYWSCAIAFVDSRLDKAKIRYIEHILATEVANCDPNRLLTKSTYGKTKIKDSQIAVAEEFTEHAKTLLDALGMKLIEVAPKAENKDQYLYCKSKNASATGFISVNGFTVLKGSCISPQTAPSFASRPYFKLREKLIEEKIVVDYTFTRDYEFQAPSAASSVVLGRASNGKKEWKDKKGNNIASD